jgi:hypothetical protein
MIPLLTRLQLINAIGNLQKKKDQETILKNWFKLGSQLLRAKKMLNKGIYVK